MQPGIYDIIPAPDILRPFVRRFMYANVQQPIDIVVKPAPTGFNYLGYKVAGELTATVDGKLQDTYTPFHFSGQIQHQDISVRYRGPFKHLLAEFTPTGLYRLLSVRGARVHARTIDIAAVDAELGCNLATALAAPDEKKDRVQALASFLADLVLFASGPTEFVDDAVTLIESNKGRVQIGDICAELDVSERSLNRQFRDIVGLPPKYYARVVQLNTMLELLMSGNDAALTEVAHECGYYDQSHFVKTMQQFFQQSPREFLDSEHDILKQFLAKSRILDRYQV